MAENAFESIKNISTNEAIGLYDMRFVKPLDKELLHTIFKQYKVIITIEDGVLSGGFGSAIKEFASLHQYNLIIESLGINDVFLEHGTIHELQELAGISSEEIKKTIQSYL